MKWTQERCALLGWLIGQGWQAEQIANHPMIHATANNVHRHAQRFGLSFRKSASARFMSGLAGRPFDEAAAKRGLTREGLFKIIMTVIASDPVLIDNILDDAETLEGVE